MSARCHDRKKVIFMRFYLISDNVDTQVGMRLAGIEGVVVHEADEVRKGSDRRYGHGGCRGHPDYRDACSSFALKMVYDLKLNRKRP